MYVCRFPFKPALPLMLGISGVWPAPSLLCLHAAASCLSGMGEDCSSSVPPLLAQRHVSPRSVLLVSGKQTAYLSRRIVV